MKRSSTSYRNVGDCTHYPVGDILDIEWFEKDFRREILYRLLSFLSVGLLPIVVYFRPLLYLRLSARRVLSSEKANVAYVTFGRNGSIVREAVDVSHYSESSGMVDMAVIEVDGKRYCASSAAENYLYMVPEAPLSFVGRFIAPTKNIDGVEASKSVSSRELLLAEYGLNAMKLPEETYAEVLFRTASSPFYLFQYFAVTLWIFEDYVVYSLLLLAISLMAIYATTNEIMYNLKRLRELVGHDVPVHFCDSIPNMPQVNNEKSTDDNNYHGTENVTDSGNPYYCYLSSNLVPGDRFIIRQGMALPCDAVLVAGRVVVDESMLTGESVAVSKAPLDTDILGNHPMDPSFDDSQLITTGSVLYGGTKVISCHSYGHGSGASDCIAVCYRTGFRSAKGQLVASLLHPKEGFLTFISDAFTVILLMIFLTTLIYLFVAYQLKRMGESDLEIFVRYFDALTIAVPPALGACLTVATAISVDRLKMKDIFVSDTSRVNFAGAVGAACFDKTGTLTESTMVFQGALISSTEDEFASTGAGIFSFGTLSTVDGEESAAAANGTTPERRKHRQKDRYGNDSHTLYEAGNQPEKLPRVCVELMATCHSLSPIEQEDGSVRLVGDPLEMELFRASGFSLNMPEPGNGSPFITVSPSALPGSIFTTGGSSVTDTEAVDQKYSILRHFEFTPEKLRSATLLRRPATTPKSEAVNPPKPEPVIDPVVVISDKEEATNASAFAATPVNTPVSMLPIPGTESIGYLANIGSESIGFLTNLGNIGAESVGYLAKISTESVEYLATLSTGGASDGEIVYVVKGSPETIVAMCNPATVPPNLFQMLRRLARSGQRVLAMAYRACSEPLADVMAMSQSAIERTGDLRFLGLLYLSSQLKASTRTTISTLQEADVLVKMITGDHIHTAIAVAQDCGIVQKKEFEPPVLADEQKEESDDDDVFKVPTPRDGTSSIKSVSVGGGSSKEGRGSSLANFFSRKTTKPLTISQRSEGMDLKIYIVDENGISGRVQITDAVTDDIIRISLEDLLEKVSNNASSSPSISAGDGEYIELAVTGAGIESVRRDYPEGILRTLVRHAAVFARTKPADKKFVVEELMMTPEFADLRVVRSVDLREGNSDLEAMKKSHYDAEAGKYLTDESAQPLLTASPNKTNRGVWSGQSEEVNFDDKDLTSEKCYHVLFCGDGANDMTALRAATVGVSLCDTETSIAAPITSKMQSPGAVIDVLLEGRSSLVTAYVLVMFNVMYGVIQLFMCCLLYSLGLSVGNYMYLVQDLFYTLVLGLAISVTPCSSRLSKRRPPKRFVNAYVAFKLISQICCFIFFQIAALKLLEMQSFYVPYDYGDDPLSSTYSYESSTIDAVALAQLMIASVVSTIGEPFRKNWYRNFYHVSALAIQGLWLLFQIFSPYTYLTGVILQLEALPTQFGIKLCILIAVNWAVSLMFSAAAEMLLNRRPNNKQKNSVAASVSSVSTAAAYSAIGGTDANTNTNTITKERDYDLRNGNRSNHRSSTGGYGTISGR